LLAIQPQPALQSSQMSVLLSQNTLVVGLLMLPLQQPTFSMTPHVPLHCCAEASEKGTASRRIVSASILK